MNLPFAATLCSAVCGKCDVYIVYWEEERNPINSALLIKESWARSDSNIILRESEKKLIQLIHDKQFHLIMIGHPRSRFSFMRISLILYYLLDPNKERERSWSKTSLAISSQKNIIPSHYHELRDFGCLTHGRYVNGRDGGRTIFRWLEQWAHAETFFKCLKFGAF